MKLFSLYYTRVPLRGTDACYLTLTDEFLIWINIPCSVDDMQIYRVDTAVELTFDEDTSLDEHMRILKRSIQLPHHKLDFFLEKEHKAKDCKCANKHSYTQYRKSAVFLAYDRTAQLEMVDAIPAALIGKRTLRLEVQFRREGMKKWVGKDEMNKDNWKIIQMPGRKAENIILWYLDPFQPVDINYVRYSDAKNVIGHVRGKETRKRMLYLLQRIDEGESITTALEDMKEEYHLSKG